MLTEKMQTALNGQLNAELYSSYLYLSMNAYFKSVNLDGFANWMHYQAQEELEHSLKFYDFIIQRGGKVHLQQIEAPPTEWDSPLAVFEATFPTILYSANRDTDRGSAVGYAVAEFVDRLSFVETGQTLIIVSTININMLLDVLTELFADSGEYALVTTLSHQTIGEVGVHTGTIPVALNWFWMQVNAYVMLFTDFFSEVTSNPSLVASLFSALGEYLVFPLTLHNFSIDTFNVQACFQTRVEVLFYDLTANSKFCADGAVEWALGWWEVASCGEA